MQNKNQMPLGAPIPPSPHAVSVSLPLWEHVVGYEEKRPEVIEKLRSGYPRFVVHELVRELAGKLGNAPARLPFPSLASAQAGAAFIRRHSGEAAEVREIDGVQGVVTTQRGEPALRAFWQHTGLIVSTRHAEALLAGRKEPSEAGDIRQSLRRQLAALYDCTEGDVFLTPTGMAAEYAALRALVQRRPSARTAQLGFSYVDTLKLQEKFGSGGILLHALERLEADLIDLLRHETLAGCFCEIPGNPLLGSVDLRKVGPILRQAHLPLVVDDVVATPFNIDVTPHADLIATSLTKFIAGSGDVMGGALICNPRSPFYHELKPIVMAQHEELLRGEDAAVLDRQARGFAERMRRHNENGLCIAERLRMHPAVERVWYPKWEFSSAYESVRRLGGGWGGLVTFLPHDAPSSAPAIYDRLPCRKGPSLGTTFTLACPFTLLAHYTELEWAENCGVSRYLIRLSAGLEDPEEIWADLNAALST